MTGAPSQRRTWADGPWAAALLAAVVTLVFARSLGGDFVWDDRRFIAENPSVVSPVSWLRFLTDPTTVDTLGARGIVRPLRTLEFALDHALFGLSPFAFRLHGLVWHLVGSLAFLGVLRRLLGDGRAALLGAVFWAIHPAQTESVAFVSSRGDLAMGALVHLSVYFAIRREGRGADVAMSLAAAALAPLEKETGVALPILIAALRATGRTRAPVLAYVGVSAAYLAYRFAVQSGAVDHGAGFVLGGSTAGTFATMARAFGFYVADVLLPTASVDWYLPPSRSLADPAALAWAAAIVGLVVLAWRSVRERPLVTIGVAWSLAFLAPVANWPVFLGIPTAERFLYLPLGGAALAVAASGPRTRRAAWAVTAVLACLTVERTAEWRSDDALFAAITRDHESPRALDTLARRRRAEGVRLRDEAVRADDPARRAAAMADARVVLEDALRLAHEGVAFWRRYEATDRPRSTLAAGPHVTASNTAYILGRDAEALHHAEEAIAIRDDDRRAHMNRAFALLPLRFAPQAADAMDRSVALGTPLPDAEIAAFYLRAADACEARSLRGRAAKALVSARDAAAPSDPTRAAAEARLAAPPRPDDPAEEAATARLAAELSALPRGCPAAGHVPK